MKSNRKFIATIDRKIFKMHIDKEFVLKHMILKIEILK